MEGLCHMNCGRYTLAASCFQRFLDMPAPPEWYPTNVGDYRGMSRRNLEKINQKLRPAGMPGLSACITGRNEQEQVVSCIKSVNEIASEVIYVDAGSTDSSRDVAAQYGAKVVSTNWDRDYSALKNLAVENASGSWVLVLNSDEVLSAEGFWEVARLLANPEFPGYTVGVRSHLLKGQPVVGSQISGSVRLFKQEQGYVFQGFLGESAVNKEPEVKAGLSGVIIEHMHFLASKEHICEKKKWKQEVIDKMELEHDRNYYMGRLHCFNGEYSLAARFFNSPPSAAWHYYYHAIALMAMPRIGEAKLMLEDGIRRYPDYTDLYYLLARANILAGYFEIAENLLLKCIEMGESSYGKYVVIPGSGGFRALCLLSGLYHKTGRAALAVDTLAKVFEIISQEKIAGWCKPDATSLAVYSLVTLSKYLEKPVSEILAGYGLMNVPNLCVAARAYSALGLFDEGIRYLRLALELMLDDSPLAAGVDRIAKELERLWKSSLARLAQYPGNKSFLRKIGLAGTSGELDGIFTHSI